MPNLIAISLSENLFLNGFTLPADFKNITDAILKNGDTLLIICAWPYHNDIQNELAAAQIPTYPDSEVYILTAEDIHGLHPYLYSCEEVLSYETNRKLLQLHTKKFLDTVPADFRAPNEQPEPLSNIEAGRFYFEYRRDFLKTKLTSLEKKFYQCCTENLRELESYMHGHLMHFDLLFISTPLEAAKDPLHQLRIFLLIHDLIAYCGNKSINQFRYYLKAQLPDYCEQDSEPETDADIDDINDDYVKPIWLIDPNQTTVASANEARLHGVQFNSAEDLSTVIKNVLTQLSINVTALEFEPASASVSSSTLTVAKSRQQQTVSHGSSGSGSSSSSINPAPVFISTNSYRGTFLSPADSASKSHTSPASENQRLIEKSDVRTHRCCCLIL